MDQIPLARPEMDQEMIDAASFALQNERLVMGESVFKFEEAFARYVGVKHAVSLSSGTDALIVTLVAMDCAGKDVVTTPFSFIATANCIIHARGNAVFSDVSPHDFNLDPALLRNVIKKGTKAIMPVHLFGHPCDMAPISELAEEKGVLVIEDACQAHGARYLGRRTGALGHVGCFSFYPTKNMTVGGDGGMVTTDDEDLAKTVAKYRDCGRINRYLHDVVGYTSRLNNCNAAIGLVQLKRLDGWNERRRQIARCYDRRLKDVNGVELPPGPSRDVEPVYHLYVLKAERRDELAKHLADSGIMTAVHYPTPIHHQPIFQRLQGTRNGAYPVSEMLSQKVISLPMYPSMTDEQVDRVCESVISYYR